MNRNRCICFLLLAVLAVSIIVLPAAAEDDSIYFTAINNTLLELTKETMPVSFNSLIYVPCSVFNTRALCTYAYYSRSDQTALISDGEKILYFDMSDGSSYDNSGNTYSYAAHYVNDTAYVPAYYVAHFFDLGYSYIRKGERNIVRLTLGSVLSDEEFFSAASSLIETRLNQYLSLQATPELTPAPTPSVTPSPVLQTPPPPVVTPPIIEDRSGVAVRLCYMGIGAETAGILDALGGTHAAFFATAEQIYDHADLTRRILGSGCTLGLLLGGDAAAEYGDFSRALRDTAMSASFLCAVSGASEEAALEAEALGLCCYYSPEIRESSVSCYTSLTAAQQTCDLLLAGDFTETETLLQYLAMYRYTVAPVTEILER